MCLPFFRGGGPTSRTARTAARRCSRAVGLAHRSRRSMMAVGRSTMQVVIVSTARRVFAVPEVGREPDHQADQQSVEIASVRSAMSSGRSDSSSSSREIAHSSFEDSGCCSAKTAGASAAAIDRSNGCFRSGRRQGLDRPGRSAPSWNRRPARNHARPIKTRARPEGVVERAVGNADAGADRADGDRGGPGCRRPATRRRPGPGPGRTRAGGASPRYSNRAFALLLLLPVRAPRRWARRALFGRRCRHAFANQEPASDQGGNGGHQRRDHPQGPFSGVERHQHQHAHQENQR